MIIRALRSLLGRGPSGSALTGEWGEEQAAGHLKAKGWRILGRRVRQGNREEIDIVARDGESLVFVEVKTRASDMYGRPAASVDRNKKRLLCRAAARYLSRMSNPRVFYRFDVVEVLGSPKDGVRDLRHIVNAFPMDRKYTI